jgi:uncharacterized repeat protein (TIGR02543 family)
MKNLLRRGLVGVAIVLLVSCTNPFFEALLGEQREGSQGGSSATYTVSFDSNDGTVTILATKRVTTPALVIGVEDFPGEPTRAGYAFAGWNTESDGTGIVFTEVTLVNADITVYARWVEVPSDSYVVTFRLNDGTSAIHDVKTAAEEGSLGGEFPAEPNRTGYTFGSWNMEPNGMGSAFTASTTVSADIQVYAQWTAKTYTVTFKSNYGANETLYTRKVTVPTTFIGTAQFPPTPIRTHYTFRGWNTQADGLGDGFTAISEVYIDRTVWAQWEWTGQFIITLDLDDGEGAFSEQRFTISINGTSGTPQSQTITITGDYINPRWYVDNVLKGTANSITINAADYNVGGHSLSLLINKGGVSLSKDIPFTVIN